MSKIHVNVVTRWNILLMISEEKPSTHAKLAGRYSDTVNRPLIMNTKIGK